MRGIELIHCEQAPTVEPAMAATGEVSQLWAWATASQVIPSLLATNSTLTDSPKERRDPYVSRDQLPLPTQPPFTAHLANLSFDAMQGDIEQFFQDCQVTSVRIVEDKLDRKPKGFGYVEFATQDGLKTALTLSGTSLAGRQVRISIAEPREFLPTFHDKVSF